MYIEINLIFCLFLHIKMQNILQILFFSSHFFNYISPFDIYYGDVSIDNYIQTSLCQIPPSQMPKLKWASILIIKSNSSFSNQYFTKYRHCFALTIETQTNSKHIHLLANNFNFKFKHLQIIIFQPEMLANIILEMNQMYFNLTSLRQMIVLLPMPISKTKINLIQATLPKTEPDFKLTIVSINSKQVIHIRPILYGCYQNSGMYLPKTQADFQALSLSYRKCTLPKVTLNVSVNDVLSICSLLRSPNGNYLSVRDDFSYEWQIVILLEKVYNFTVRLVDAQQVYSLPYKVNTSWYTAGLIGQVYNKVTCMGAF